MEKSLESILGTKKKLTGLQASLLMEEFICEGISYSSNEINNTDNKNLFGREIYKELTPNLSFTTGIASTGLRAVSFVTENKTQHISEQLKEASRNHFPLVVQISGNNLTDIFQKVVDTGCFLLVANTPQEALDFMLMAHRISELSLVPGVVFTTKSTADLSSEVIFPNKNEIIDFIGNPDDRIDCISPSQRMIFGDQRRRIPNWFTPDLPMLSGVSKNSQETAMEVAANHRFFLDHLNEFIDEVFTEFESTFGRKYNFVSPYKTEDADYDILVAGTSNESTRLTIDSLRTRGEKVGCLLLSVVCPFPEKQILDEKPKKGLTILENVGNDITELSPIYIRTLSAFQTSKNTPKIYSGQYTNTLESKDLETVFFNMKEEGKVKFYLNVEFAQNPSNFPKQQILLQNIDRAYPDSNDYSLTFSNQNPKKHPHKTPPEIPNILRRYKDLGAPYSKESRFYDHTGVFYQTDCKEELVADPFNAVASIPPATANFINQTETRKTIPQFNPLNCTGCGDCFVTCPHSALPPIAISVEALIKSGIELASGKGMGIAKITPVINNLSKLSSKVIQESQQGISHAKDFLPNAFEGLVVQMKLEGEKLDNLKNEFEAILEEVKNFPVSINDAFFNKPELVEKGTGELFSLAIDPTACTGCGVCTDACNDEALSMVEGTKEVVEDIGAKFQLWENLHDTDGHCISKKMADKEYNSLAALLLSRNFYLSMTGGSTSEKGASAKTLTHLITATTEFLAQKNIKDEVNEIDQHIKKISENIHTRLSDAMPSEDFEDLGRILDDSNNTKQSIDDIIHKLSESHQVKTVDSTALKRKIGLLNELKNLKWVLTDGPTGMGRSRYSLAYTLSKLFHWAKEYPFNSFTTPAMVHWDGSVAGKVLGLFHGQLRYVLDHIKILRRAKLEAKNKYDPSIHDEEIAMLTWSDLEGNEKALVPPMLLLTDKNHLDKYGNQALLKILNSDLPIKICVFDDLASTPDYHSGSYLDQILPVATTKNTYMMVGSLASKEHLFSGMQEGINFQGPAFFYIHTPDQSKHVSKYSKWHTITVQASLSRAWPMVKFNPNIESQFMSSLFDFEGNRQMEAEWVTDEIEYTRYDGETTMDYTLTYADWLFTLKAWGEHFRLISIDEESKLPVAEYLNLDEKQRKDKIPFIVEVANSELKYYAVSDKVIERTEKCLINWNTLKEYGGVLIEHPEKLKKQIEEELKSEHESELAAAKKNYEAKLKEQEAEQVDKIRLRLKNKLLELSKQNSN